MLWIFVAKFFDKCYNRYEGADFMSENMMNTDKMEKTGDSPKPTGQPLGYIHLETGAKPIMPMNDIFLNYHFEKKEHWEDLRSIINIFIADYAEQYPDTVAKPVEGAIEVETQYKYFLNPDKAARNQDFKVSGKDITFIEFQNKAHTTPPIKIRATQYFGLGIGHSEGKLSNQIWLLAEDIKEILHGQMYANYIFTDEASKAVFPQTSGMMFVSLQKLALQNPSTPASELAAFLLGILDNHETITNNEVKHIAKMFKTTFGIFREDKEAKNMMTMAERWRRDARFEGVVDGISKGVVESAVKIIQAGTPLQEAIRILDLSDYQAEQVKEIIATESTLTNR